MPKMSRRRRSAKTNETMPATTSDGTAARWQPREQAAPLVEREAAAAWPRGQGLVAQTAGEATAAAIDAAAAWGSFRGAAFGGVAIGSAFGTSGLLFAAGLLARFEIDDALVSCAAHLPRRFQSRTANRRAARRNFAIVARRPIRRRHDLNHAVAFRTG